MDFVVWGAGIRGARVVKLLGKEKIRAFIDIDKKKQGGMYCEIPVISYKEYLEKYRDSFVVISLQYADSTRAVISDLEREKVYNYFVYSDNPSEVGMPQNEGIPYKEIMEEFGISRDKNIALYGKTLFTVLTYEYMLNNGFKVRIVEKDSLIIDALKRTGEFGFCKKDDEWVEKILITDRMDFLYRQENGYGEKEEPFYRFSSLKRYRNEELKKFKNKHKDDKRIFIIGSGPSLKIEDLETLHRNHEITFGVNQQYVAFNKTNWRPNYYMYINGDELYEERDTVLNLDINTMFLTDCNENLWEDERTKEKNIYKYHVIWEQYNEEGPDFSDEVENGIYTAETVIYGCIQMAVYMGFKKIYLIGVDMNASYQKSATKRENYFIEGYIPDSARGMEHRTEIDKINDCFKRAKIEAKKYGCKIYNAARGGQLDVFERVDLDSLF